ncbi:MAG: MJ0042-type zinc finger domain-containing protein, partial [Pseudolabrys sp.]
MVSDPLTDGWYVGHPITIDPMLIACPNCSTSYMIDPASLGEAGRTVRCARCKTAWFASTPEMAGAGTDDDPTSAIGVTRP